MRLIGFKDGRDRWIGAVDSTGMVSRIAPADTFYSDPAGALESARRAPATPEKPAEFAPPVPATAKVLCVGLNYRAHAEEADVPVPDYPTVFGRWESTLVCDGDEVPVPACEPGLDWEAELAVIIGRTLTDASEEEALGGVLGFTCFNDVSARKRQFDTTQWTLGKNPDRSGPIGPVVVTADEWGGPDGWSGRKVVARVNGEVMQSGDTSEMIFSVGRILSYISQTTTLRPGDVVATGTPAGVGFIRKPPVLLTPGDVVEVEIDGVGVLRNPVVGPAGRP
ncbi:fumarylacetoacetate hydrolase family protein [Streptomyces albipurpureus]|uniref:Fumarylacetoacetate hydrolase family protein n=1 Tax=Streptomyces albipurpureus TaxID=2897419 RepID=A0ABT0V2J4_9ACTN|nr:fumarylacetoacetate hydrolase family protein [Streptomyces sp. CWNU-1]MCM2394105.1 fumarylacetoacetate hydrolase family protein [Streptomyces sp. CWNU-1]